MISGLDIAIAMVLLLGYCYTLISARAIMARPRVSTDVYANIGANTGFKDIKAALVGFSHSSPEARKAIGLLKLNNYIICVFFVLLIYSLKFEKNAPVGNRVALTKTISHP